MIENKIKTWIDNSNKNMASSMVILKVNDEIEAEQFEEDFFEWDID